MPDRAAIIAEAAAAPPNSVARAQLVARLQREHHLGHRTCINYVRAAAKGLPIHAPRRPAQAGGRPHYALVRCGMKRPATADERAMCAELAGEIAWQLLHGRGPQEAVEIAVVERRDDHG